MYNRLNSKNARDETSMDDDKNKNYGAAVAPSSESAGPLYVPTCGLVFYVMAFFGFVCALLLRESLSVAIVAMVNQTAVTEADVDAMTNESGECPRDPKLQYEDGEFNWDRNQQGIVLAAFYYGYGLLQVYVLHQNIGLQCSCNYVGVIISVAVHSENMWHTSGAKRRKFFCRFWIFFDEIHVRLLIYACFYFCYFFVQTKCALLVENFCTYVPESTEAIAGENYCCLIGNLRNNV